MTIYTAYRSVSELCTQHHLTSDDFLDIFLSENMKLCIYLANLKTYYFDFTLVNDEVDEFDVQSYFISGLFYLTTYESCKILHKGEADISRVQPKGKTFITLAHPHKILFSDLLVDTDNFNLFNRCRFHYEQPFSQANILSA